MPDETAPEEVCIATPSAGGRARVVSIGEHEVRTTSREALKTAGIKNGVHMTPAVLDRLLAQVETEAASTRAMRLLGHRERSRAELRDRLTEDGYPEPVARAVVDRMEELGLLDDERFAEAYVRTKMAAGWGRDRIVRGLTSAGLDPERIAVLVEQEMPETAELDRALTMLPDEIPRERRDRERYMRRLISRGFSYDIARRALERRSDVANSENRNRFES